MIVYDSFLPLYEAITYLLERFSDKRLSNRLADNIKEKDIKQNPSWATFAKIADIEKKLDSEFKDSDILRFYFNPLKTREEVPCKRITLGSILNFPDDLPRTINYDDLISFYKDIPPEKLYRHICDTTLFSSSSFSPDECRNLSDFVSILDAFFSDPQEKWNMIDVISDPIRHLKKLRPIVEKVEARFIEYSNDFKSLIAELHEDFSTENRYKESLELLGIKLSKEEAENALFYPSLFMFNGINISGSSKNQVQIILGVFVLPLIKSREYHDIGSHLTLLKLLSDETRLKVLKEICNDYSYGQELAEKFGVSRNAMYYHLEKISGFGLASRHDTEYRTLFIMNKKNVYNRVTALRDFLVDGWKPENEQ